MMFELNINLLYTIISIVKVNTPKTNILYFTYRKFENHNII